MFCPHAAVVAAHEVPTSEPLAERYVAFLQVKKGTKGGRLRFTAVRTDAQRRTLERAGAFAAFPSSHLGHPGLTLKQSLKRFENVVRKAGITKSQLGVTPHGLRHQFAADLFFDITGIDTPVCGGEVCVTPDMLRDARLQVARQLGHGRPQISAAYLGSAAVNSAAPTIDDRKEQA
jgi:integrase